MIEENQSISSSSPDKFLIFIEGQAWSFGALGDFRYCSLISFLLSRETTHVEKPGLI